MSSRKFLNILVSLMMLTSLVLGTTFGATAMPADPKDSTRVPHYFGPWPNWTNSPFTVPDAKVEIAGDGTGATAVATVGAGGVVLSITVTDPGRGYSSAKVTITGSGTGAEAKANIIKKGSVVDVQINAPGAGYTAPAVAITGNGTGASASAFGSVDHVTLANGGSGYTFPTVEFDLPDAPGGVQAKGHAVVDANGTITDVIVDSPGSGYANAPGVSILNGTVFDPVTLNPGGSFASATTTLSVTGIVLDTFGSGYSKADVTISESAPAGAGSGALATAFLDNGIVSSIDLTKSGSGYLTPGGIQKFVDTLPGLTPAGANNLGQYLPIAVPDTTTFPGTDYYVIGLVQHREKMHSSLPPTLLREYVQLPGGTVGGSVPLTTDLLVGSTPALMPDGSQAYGVDNPHYLGPLIIAQKDRAVRITFYNLLPKGADGDLFLPVDTTIMGSGEGNMMMGFDPSPVPNGTVMDDARNPHCTDKASNGMRAMCFTDNRATLHLHGGNTPWISDGTPHQWITPANEVTAWPQGVSVQNVPDMVGAGKPASVPDCSGENDGCMTFYYTNQQSARLMFYHDHSWGITRLNVYAGEAAGYLIEDPVEQNLVSKGIIPADQIPLIIQDRTFVPQDAAMLEQDPTWDAARWGGYGSLWYHHVYMPAQNPGDPGGMSAYGRWMYGPWFWPPATDTKYGPIVNPYYEPTCNLDDPLTWQYQTDPFCEPQYMPGTPNVSAGMEQFNDTPIVNGTAYPTTTLQPKSYRFRILNAANDRFWNLQWYVADSTGTEVALKAAEVQAAQTDPNIFPTPDTALSPAGPSWIQIGTEGGFLPAPVVVPNQPITWITDPTRFDVGNVDQHSLLLAPAERADAIVDFSKYAGKTLILYNDAPAAFPARVPSYDYYTGAPDLSPGGAPAIMPGYGPNTRTIMQVKIASTGVAPSFNLSALNAAFKHHADGTGVFEAGQPPIIVGQAAYNSAYGTNFAASGWCSSPSSLIKCDGFVRITQQGGVPFTFDTLRGLPSNTKMSMPLEPKAIHDEMNASTFDEFGRMQANLGIENVPATPGLTNVNLMPYVFPSTEIIDTTNLPRADVQVTPIASADDGTQIWRITHNGVDTHPIHFHAFDVQVINRVTWDNIIIRPDATELGWKDTVRISPLEDTIVALRPIIPTFPFELPNSVRLLSPMQPEGMDWPPTTMSTGVLGSATISDLLGIGIPPSNPAGEPVDILNHYVNFGGEYVYHCHILSHEEMDMMRPVLLAYPPKPPVNVAFNAGTMVLNWTDDSISETGFVIEKSSDGGMTWTELGRIARDITAPNVTGEVLTYPDGVWVSGDMYRVAALNTVGDTWDYANGGLNELAAGGFPHVTVKSPYANSIETAPPAAPANLAAVAQVGVAGAEVALTWDDNALNETDFVIERSDNGAGFVQIATAPALAGTGQVSFIDTNVVAGSTYDYQVAARNGVGMSAYSNIATVLVPLPSTPPADPSNLQALLQNGPKVSLSWTDNAIDEASFVIERADNGAPFAQIATAPALNGSGGTVTYLDSSVAAGNTYDYRVAASNNAGPSGYSNTASAAVPAVPTAPVLSVVPPTGMQVDLSWTDGVTQKSFVLWRSTDNVTFVSLATLAGTALTYSDTAVVAGGSYWYQVEAVNESGSALSNTVSVTIPFNIPPAAPSGLSASNLTPTSVTINWLDNSNNEQGFRIQISSRSGFQVNATQTTQLGPNITSYNFTGLVTGTRYYFRVQAFNGAGSSAWSPVFSIRVR